MGFLIAIIFILIWVWMVLFFNPKILPDSPRLKTTLLITIGIYVLLQLISMCSTYF